MTTAKEIIAELQRMFPKRLREKWDTTDGLVRGRISRRVGKAIVSLEFRENVPCADAEMFILHHPPVFGPGRRVTNPFYRREDVRGKVVYAVHTRMDRTGFVGKAIAERLFGEGGYVTLKVLRDGTAIIRLKRPMAMKEVLHRVKGRLKLRSVNAIVKRGRVRKVGILGGSAFRPHHLDPAVAEGIDLYLGGEMGHHLAEHAHFFDVSLIDIGHFSEQEGMRKLAEVLRRRFPEVDFEYVEQRPQWDSY
jgi:putative NIF3 family GTP cyclohydrolase 1 type 2